MEVLLEHEHVVLLTIDGECEFLHPYSMKVEVNGVFVCVLVVNGLVSTMV